MRKKEENTKFVNDLLPSAIALVLIWGVFFIEKLLPFSLAKYGVLPGSFVGLRGILFMPFIHGSLTHIADNSLPLAILLFYLFSIYREVAMRVIIWSILMTGVWVWISARPSYHIGASGLIYGLASFLFFSGLFRKNNRLMAVSLGVAFFYGSLIWGIFPIDDKVSYEGHFWGAISGAILAMYYKKVGPQRIKYNWEQMSEEDYLRDNIQRYGEYYWDPVKHAEIMRAKEEQNSTASSHYDIVYYFLPNNQAEANDTNGDSK